MTIPSSLVPSTPASTLLVRANQGILKRSLPFSFNSLFCRSVGRNGAGKSNLFSAIEYVLDPRPLRQEARQALVHNGRKAVGQNSTAFVEIVFDNSDRKLPVENDMVSLKRVLGLKKDQFYCNNKLVGNVKEFLDSAGFSNPYFIVKQGKVQELAAGSDAMRLKVLKDAAGLTSFSETQKNNEEMQESKLESYL